MTDRSHQKHLALAKDSMQLPHISNYLLPGLRNTYSRFEKWVSYCLIKNGYKPFTLNVDGEEKYSPISHFAVYRWDSGSCLCADVVCADYLIECKYNVRDLSVMYQAVGQLYTYRKFLDGLGGTQKMVLATVNIEPEIAKCFKEFHPSIELWNLGAPSHKWYFDEWESVCKIGVARAEGIPVDEHWDDYKTSGLDWSHYWG